MSAQHPHSHVPSRNASKSTKGFQSSCAANLHSHSEGSSPKDGSAPSLSGPNSRSYISRGQAEVLDTQVLPGLLPDIPALTSQFKTRIQELTKANCRVRHDPQSKGRDVEIWRGNCSVVSCPVQYVVNLYLRSTVVARPTGVEQVAAHTVEILVLRTRSSG